MWQTLQEFSVEGRYKPTLIPAFLTSYLLMKDSWKADRTRGPTLRENHPEEDFTPP